MLGLFEFFLCAIWPVYAYSSRASERVRTVRAYCIVLHSVGPVRNFLRVRLWPVCAYSSSAYRTCAYCAFLRITEPGLPLVCQDGASVCAYLRTATVKSVSNIVKWGRLLSQECGQEICAQVGHVHARADQHYLIEAHIQTYHKQTNHDENRYTGHAPSRMYLLTMSSPPRLYLTIPTYTSL